MAFDVLGGFGGLLVVFGGIQSPVSPLHTSYALIYDKLRASQAVSQNGVVYTYNHKLKALWKSRFFIS